MAEREAQAREWKFQDMNAPVGSPLNFIKMNSSSRGSKRDEFNPNMDAAGSTTLYPFPIEDANRTEDQEKHREINKAEARQALLNQIQYNDMKR